MIDPGQVAWKVPEPNVSVHQPSSLLFPSLGTKHGDLQPAHLQRVQNASKRHNTAQNPPSFFDRLPLEVFAKILHMIHINSLPNFLSALPKAKDLMAMVIPHNPQRFCLPNAPVLDILSEQLRGVAVTQYDRDHDKGLIIKPLVRVYEVEDFGLYKPGQFIQNENTLTLQHQSNTTLSYLLRGGHKTVSCVVVRSTPGYLRSCRLQHALDTLVLKGSTIVEESRVILMDRSELLNDYDPVYFNSYPVDTMSRYALRHSLLHRCGSEAQQVLSPTAFTTSFFKLASYHLPMGILSLTLTNCTDVDNLELPLAHHLLLVFPRLSKSVRRKIRNVRGPYIEVFEVRYYEKPPVFTDVQVGERAHAFDEPEELQRRIDANLAPVQCQRRHFKLVDQSTEGNTTLRGRSTIENELHNDTDLSFTKHFQVIEISGGPTDELLSRLSFDNATHLIVREQRQFYDSPLTPCITMPELTDLNFDTVIPGRTAPSFKTPKLKNLYLRSTAPGFDPESALDFAPSELDRLYVGLITRNRGQYTTYEFKKKHMEKFAEKIVWLSLQGVACPSLDLPSNELKMPALRYAVFDLLPTDEQRATGEKRLRIRALNYSPDLTRLTISQNTTGSRPWWDSVEVPHVHSRGVYVHGFPDDAISLDGYHELGLMKMIDGASERMFFEGLYFRPVYGERFLPSIYTRIPSDWLTG